MNIVFNVNHVLNWMANGFMYGAIGGTIYMLVKGYLKNKKRTGNPRHFGRRR